jgi:hypothetical protein
MPIAKRFVPQPIAHSEWLRAMAKDLLTAAVKDGVLSNPEVMESRVADALEESWLLGHRDAEIGAAVRRSLEECRTAIG